MNDSFITQLNQKLKNRRKKKFDELVVVIMIL